jgi:hypothetical protein
MHGQVMLASELSKSRDVPKSRVGSGTFSGQFENLVQPRHRAPPRRLFFDVPRPVPVLGRWVCFEAFDALEQSH